MVSGFQDELDPDDTEPSLPQPKTLPPSKDITLTSDEEEAGVERAPTVTRDQDLDSEPELKAYVSYFYFMNVDSLFTPYRSCFSLFIQHFVCSLAAATLITIYMSKHSAQEAEDTDLWFW